MQWNTCVLRVGSLWTHASTYIFAKLQKKTNNLQKLAAQMNTSSIKTCFHDFLSFLWLWNSLMIKNGIVASANAVFCHIYWQYQLGFSVTSVPNNNYITPPPQQQSLQIYFHVFSINVTQNMQEATYDLAEMQL